MPYSAKKESESLSTASGLLAPDRVEPVFTIDAVEQPARAPVCPDCKGALIAHTGTNPYKVGAMHCNGCGQCWAPGLKQPR